MVAQQLERDDVRNRLETIERSRNDDGLVVLLIEDESRSIRTFLQCLVAFAADDNGNAFPSRDLCHRTLAHGSEKVWDSIHLSECGFDLLEVRVLRHDDNDGHILV
jgi:hypothetical protein